MRDKCLCVYEWREFMRDWMDVRYHEGHGGYVVVHFEGLGAFDTECDNLEDAIEQVKRDTYGKSFAAWIEGGEGDGHFDADDCVGYHFVKKSEDGTPDWYVFEIDA